MCGKRSDLCAVPNPNGIVDPSSPGLERGDYPGCMRLEITPHRGCANETNARRCNPFGVEDGSLTVSQGGPCRAGLEVGIPSGFSG